MPGPFDDLKTELEKLPKVSPEAQQFVSDYERAVKAAEALFLERETQEENLRRQSKSA